MTDTTSRLIPKPRDLTPGQGAFPWNSSAVPAIIIDSGDRNDSFAAQTLLWACEDRSLPMPKILGADTISEAAGSQLILAGDPCRHLRLLQAMREEGLEIFPEMGDEGYLLHVTPSRILIAGNTAPAIFYGFQTLIQLLPQGTHESAEIPALTIRDWPSLKQRGISMDIARGEVYTPDAFKDHIARLAHYKINMLALYLEDAFKFPSHPEIGEDRDRLTYDEVRDIDEFAQKHHVMLVPALDSPGHMERFLSHPHFEYLAEGTENEHLRAVINITHPDAYPFLSDLYGDICKAFSSPYVALCGDEAFGLGRGKSKEDAEAFGRGNLHVRHIKRIRSILADHGKRPCIAGDPFEPGFFAAFGVDNFGLEALWQVPRDAIIFPWHYGRMDQFPAGDAIKALGFEQHLYACLGDGNGMFPDMPGAMVNIATYIPHAHRLGAAAAVASSWGDRNSFREYNWPMIVFFSEWAWQNSSQPAEGILASAVERLFGPGTAPLAAVLRFLGSPAKYFGWAITGMGSPAFILFYGLLEPRELNPEKMLLLEQFRDDGHAARKAFEEAREAAIENHEFLDYIDFALYQFEVMGDLVEARHLMGKRDDHSLERYTDLVEELADSVPHLHEQYQELWHRARRPRGLEPNNANFQRLIDSILRALEAN